MKHTYKKFSRLTALLLALLIVVLSPTVGASSLEELKAQQNALTAQKQQLQNKIEALSAEESEKEERQALLAAEIETVQMQIDTALIHIAELNRSITNLEVKLEEAEKEIEDTMELLKKRLAALYSAGKVSTLEILFNSKSLHDFSVRSEMITRITRHDRQLIDEVSDYMQRTADERAALEEQKTTLANEKKLMEASQQELELLIAENNALLEEIRAEKGEAEEDLKRTEAEAYMLSGIMAALIAQMKEKEEAARPTPTPVPSMQPTPSPTPIPGTEYDENGNPLPTPTPTPVPSMQPTPTPTPVPDSPYDPTESFCWPVPGYSTVTCAFGDGHYGMDIGAPHGTPIVASRSGEVMVANGTDDWGNSWGYYVSIYHDSTFSTLYAHMSSVAVSAGQWVNKGDVIGYVGNTGYSFGNHLHFEVYKDGTRVDPAPYV
ncbi:MAG: peptidoglycan DD-metalloendopeptidase family protein [Clostridia bacterium]|nr:peptidoglycan DD-metalloendopeptidase family protein [Clostridia bacterium]